MSIINICTQPISIYFKCLALHSRRIALACPKTLYNRLRNRHGMIAKYCKNKALPPKTFEQSFYNLCQIKYFSFLYEPISICPISVTTINRYMVQNAPWRPNYTGFSDHCLFKRFYGCNPAAGIPKHCHELFKRFTLPTVVPPPSA